MLKRALQLGNIMMTPFCSIKEDMQTSEAVAPSQIRDGSFFITQRFSGKEIIITGTYLNRYTVLPHKNGIDYDRLSYWEDLKNTERKVIDLYAIGDNNRVYAIQVKVARVLKTEKTGNSFDFTIQCFSESIYWMDVTDVLYYSCVIPGKLGKDVWAYDNNDRYENYKCLDWQVFYMLPTDDYSRQLWLDSGKYTQHITRNIDYYKQGRFLVFLKSSYESELPSILRVAINNRAYIPPFSVNQLYRPENYSFEAPISIGYTLKYNGEQLEDPSVITSKVLLIQLILE